MLLEGKNAIVSGGSQGIGTATSLELAREGANVCVLYRKHEDEAKQVVDEIKAMGRKAIHLPCDIASFKDAERVVKDALAAFGRIDILVNNAGLGANHDALDVTEGDWDDMMAVNLKGLFFASQAVGRHMVERGYGRVVNLSSQVGLVGIRRHAVYSASKGGVNLVTKVLALEWAPYGVTVNAIAPTWIYTPGTAERLDDPAFLAGVLARIPIGRVGSTADVAAAVVFLSSRASGLVTGAILPVDGGWTAQ
jgi:NAD(P)-dependent dehydrogenase (short-subunit alcohol dehydrogenase family)